MPRIDPLQLLRCLSVLLSPNGGIKSTAEVQRLASLMTKFSKKLVSKCIYIQILKQTQTDLLKMFMTLGGWNLIHTWLSDAVVAKNWPLIEQLLELLLMCPVDVELLKTNSCPKLVKGLSKESTNDCVKQLACKLVEQWLRMVKGETTAGAISVATNHPPPSAVVPVASPVSTQVAESIPPVDTSVPSPSSVAAPDTVSVEMTPEPTAKEEEPQTPAEEERQHVSVQEVIDVEDNKSVEVKCEEPIDENLTPSVVECKEEVVDSKDSEQNGEVCLVPQRQEGEDDNLDGDVKKEEPATSEDSGEDAAASEGPVGQLPVYKITIRDGKQVLAKVHSGEKAQKNATVTAVVQDVEEEMHIKQEVKQNAIVSLKKLDLPVDVVEPTPKKKIEQTKGARAQKSAGKVDRSESVSSDDSIKTSKTSYKKSKEQKKLEKTVEKKSKAKETKDAPKCKNVSPKGKMLKNKKEKVEEQPKVKEKKKEKNDQKLGEKTGQKLGEKTGQKLGEKNGQKYNSGSDLDEKDKALLAKLIPPAISKLGKIPKKKKPEEPEKVDMKKPEEAKNVPEKKLPPPPPPPPPPSEPKKTTSMSIEVRKPSSAPRPKTVKTYHSKFRSTGLEEELKPPVPRAAIAVKKPVPVPLMEKKPPVKPPLPVKRPSPTRDVPVEKKLKIDIALEKEKVGGAKLIPPRPKPAFLQESDMFMDALTASSKKEPRKRKRRASNSGKEGPDAKKDVASKEEDGNKDTTPPGSPSGEDGAKSPSSIKPSFKFYQDTLEVDDEKDMEPKESRDHEGSDSGDSEENNKSQVSMDTETSQDADSTVKDDTMNSTSEQEGSFSTKAVKGVLVYHKVLKGPKKSVRWKAEKDLIDIQYFELDETERVNVTKTFTDMKQMERVHEREAFLLSRKLPQDDVMEEKISWRPLIPIDLPPSVVEPGMNSREKDVQYAREKVVLRALYFNKSSIPDSPGEPDLEIHATTDPVVIPLEDASGVQESVNDFTGTPWPDPKPMLPPPSPPHSMQYNKPQQPVVSGKTHHPAPLLPSPVMSPPHQPQPPPQQQFQPYMQQPYPIQQPGMMYAGQGMSMMAPMGGPSPPIMTNMASPMPLLAQPAGDWRTGDGKVVNMTDMSMDVYNQGSHGMGNPGMGNPGMGNPGMGNPGMGNPGMGNPGMGNSSMGNPGMNNPNLGNPGMCNPGMSGPGMPMGMGMGGMGNPDMNYGMMGASGGDMSGYPQQGFPMGGAPPMFQPQPPPIPPQQQQQQQQFAQRGNPGRRGMRGGRRGNWGGQNWQGNRGRGGSWSGGGGSGGGNPRTTVCKHFRSGYCRTGDDCPFLHPGVNGPQY